MTIGLERTAWLLGNRRVLLLGGLPVALLLGLGVVPWLLPPHGALGIGVRTFGVVLMIIGLSAATSIFRQLRLPRIACADENLLLYLRGVEPIAVPLEAVECFFLGQGPSGLPSDALEQAETSNVIVRLAENAKEWHHHEVRSTFASWCDGYITIKGAWCERITEDKLRELNSKLAQVKRERKARQAAS